MKLFVNHLVSSTRQPTIKRLNSNLAFVPAHQIPEVTQLESLRQILEGIVTNFDDFLPLSPWFLLRNFLPFQTYLALLT